MEFSLPKHTALTKSTTLESFIASVELFTKAYMKYKVTQTLTGIDADQFAK